MASPSAASSADCRFIESMGPEPSFRQSHQLMRPSVDTETNSLPVRDWIHETSYTGSLWLAAADVPQSDDAVVATAEELLRAFGVVGTGAHWRVGLQRHRRSVRVVH